MEGFFVFFFIIIPAAILFILLMTPAGNRPTTDGEYDRPQGDDNEQ